MKIYLAGPDVFLPDGQGRFPVVIQFHGCGGKKMHQPRWAEVARKAGWAAIIADSYAREVLAVTPDDVFVGSPPLAFTFGLGGLLVFPGDKTDTTWWNGPFAKLAPLPLGGIAGDFPICVVPMLHQDLQRTGVPLWGYFSQISDSTTSYGSYSGAVPNEKITWGKLGEVGPKYIIESDATIVAPLISAWVLGQ